MNTFYGIIPLVLTAFRMVEYATVNALEYKFVNPEVHIISETFANLPDIQQHGDFENVKRVFVSAANNWCLYNYTFFSYYLLKIVMCFGMVHIIETPLFWIGQLVFAATLSILDISALVTFDRQHIIRLFGSNASRGRILRILSSFQRSESFIYERTYLFRNINQFNENHYNCEVASVFFVMFVFLYSLAKKTSKW